MIARAAGCNPNFEFFEEIDTARPTSLSPPAVNLHSRLEVNQHRPSLPSFPLRPQVEWPRFGARPRLAIQEAQAKAGARQLSREELRQTARGQSVEFDCRQR